MGYRAGQQTTTVMQRQENANQRLAPDNDLTNVTQQRFSELYQNKQVRSEEEWECEV